MIVFKEKIDVIQILPLQENLQTSGHNEYQILDYQEQSHFPTEACEKSPLVQTGLHFTHAVNIYDLILFLCFTVAMSATLSSMELILTLFLQDL